ncbi:Bacteriophage T4, Gp19, tail tube [uncultured Caudovirales phage]|uniref:Bacteriophage T4, Gp19, tail tube n=1 Tax=uncultured Caudovirales phage TaxID=2100421 RepID=A0A6J5S5A7_9CAUD|nr:Bacteriophage T4, Gp19, tail tube [uncultured Caudovirales phage]
MARAQASDPLHGFRFHVRTEVKEFLFHGGDENIGGEAGFQSVTVPEVSMEAVEYREGTMTYTRKYPGVPTVTDITLMRGATKKDTAFWNWTKAAIEGGEYRTDLVIYHFHRDAKEHLKVGDLTKARQYVCRECLPLRVKPAGDLEAMASEVSLAEMDVATEYFEIIDAT